MIIAIPVSNGRLDAHFGHCEEFAFFEGESGGKICHLGNLTPPPHEPGVLPVWLAEQKASVVLAGGMGGMARRLLSEKGVDSVIGVPEEDAAKLAQRYLNGELRGGANACDHQSGSCSH